MQKEIKKTNSLNIVCAFLLRFKLIYKYTYKTASLYVAELKDLFENNVENSVLLVLTKYTHIYKQDKIFQKPFIVVL
jgi:hypothetical protein